MGSSERAESIDRPLSQLRGEARGAGRAQWTELGDQPLLRQCAVDTYRASGPGGQKRNKTSSAVRIRHKPTGIIVIAEESRSQHENKARALRRLRRQFHLRFRNPFPSDGADELPALIREQRLKVSSKNPLFWPLAGLALDALESNAGRLSEAASVLGVSTGLLVDFLETDPKLWEQANAIRHRFGHKALKS